MEIYKSKSGLPHAFSQKAGDCIYLNDNTIQIISESELGQYVMSNAYSATST